MDRSAAPGVGRSRLRARLAVPAVVCAVAAGATAGCSTTSGTSDPGDDEAATASSEVDDDGAGAYVQFMDELCTETDARISDLPEPPEQIRADLWAVEVATAFATERERADLEASPPEDVRLDHRTFVETTDELVDAWTALGASLAADADDIGDRRTEVTELALGRDAVARALGLEACDRSRR